MSSPAFTVKSKAVRAGAGAGKTYNLTHKVLDFVEDFHRHSQKWPHVMVTTFTKKATQELSERLILLALSRTPELVNYVSSPGYLTVSTIHGVLDKFLKKHGHVLGLNSDFTYFKKSEVSFQSKKLLKSLIEDSPEYQKLLASFSFTVLHSLLMTSIQNSLQGYQVLNKDHLLQLLQDELRDKKTELESLFHTFKNHELTGKWVELAQALEGIAGILKAETWQKNYPLFIDTLSTVNLRGLKSKKIPWTEEIYEQVEETVKSLRELRGVQYDPLNFEHISRQHVVFEKLRQDFAQGFFELKKSLNKIEISDLETFSLQLIRQDPAAARQFSLGKDYWLIDEFQDTSPIQVEILNALVGSRPSYVVGDPQQSIYLFRGARSEVFHNKVAEIKKAQGEEQFLDTNYRSVAPLLSLMNRLSEDLGSDFQTMKSAFDEVTKDPVAHFCIVSAKEEDKDEGEGLETAKMAEFMLKLHNQGVAYEDMAILVRKNKHLEEVASVLRTLHIPIYVHSAGFFWRRREVKDALSLLKFFINPSDDFNLISLLRSPFIAIDEQSLTDLMQLRKGSAWAQVKDRLQEGAFGVSGKNLFQLFQDKDVFGLRVTFLKALEALGVFDFHLRYDPTGRAEGNLWKFVHLLKTFEAERGASYVQFLTEAEQAAETERSVDAPGSVQPNKANIMTVHAAKGLQFDYVFLPFIGAAPYRENKMDFIVDEEEKIWSVRVPLAQEDLKLSGSLFEKKVLAQKKKREDEEDWRVFYVAYTRAKKFLYMSWVSPLKDKSWAQKISLNLSQGTHSENDFTYTVEEARELPVLTGGPQMTTQAEKVPEPYSFSRTEFYGKNKQDHLSVTEIASGGSMVSYQNSFVKKRQGTLFHRLLELLRYPENVDFHRIISSWFPDSQDEVSEALNYILTKTDPPYVQIIKQGEVEWPFVLHRENRRIEGQIDLWGIVDGKLWVVDYKSGAKVLKDKAFLQLALYAEALVEYLNWDKEVHLVVVYPFIQEEFIQKVIPAKIK